MLFAMSEERRDQAQEDARRVLSPVRLAVLLLLGAFFLVVGGSRADAAEPGPAPSEGPELVAGTLAALGAGPELAPVDGVVDPVLAAAETAIEPVVEPVVRPVVEPVVTPLRPVVEPVVTPLRPVVEAVVTPVAVLPVTELVTPVAAPANRPEPPATVHRDTEGGVDTTPARAVAPVDRTATAPEAAAVAEGSPDVPAAGMPVSGSASTTSDGGPGTTVPLAVLLAASLGVLLLAGSIAPRRVAAPAAPTFLPPVFPG